MCDICFIHTAFNKRLRYGIGVYKMIKRIILIFLISICFITTASAEETDLYKDQLEISGADELYDYVPDNVKDYLNEFSIDFNDSGWVNSLTSENAFLHIFIKNSNALQINASIAAALAGK